MVEGNLRRSLIMSDGDFSIFATSPVCAIFLIIALLTLTIPVIGRKIKGGGVRLARQPKTARAFKTAHQIRTKNGGKLPDFCPDKCDVNGFVASPFD